VTEGVIVGIFVGGEGLRLGGVRKGLLRVDGEPIAARTARLARGVADTVVLVGRADGYASLGCAVVADVQPGQGPLGGLVALLAHAGNRRVIAVACDMPFVTAALFARLAVEMPDARILAPRSDSQWEPLLARYDARVLPVAKDRLARNELSLQPLLDECKARELVLTPEERKALCDWDRPEDLP
jgi:molybdopterin-guanine dinucleotide biosynthesis protein A